MHVTYSLDHTAENAILLSFSLNNGKMPNSESESLQLSEYIVSLQQHILTNFNSSLNEYKELAINHLYNTDLIIFDTVCSYTTLLIYYNFLSIPTDRFVKELTKTIQQHNTLYKSSNGNSEEAIKTHDSQPIMIPTYYSNETGPDLSTIAEQKKLSETEIIKLHSNKIYHVYAVGFAPNFAYMGFVDKRIASPRKTTPRANVASGSVGIADQQTGIYPQQSPGGWNIIGHVPTNILTNQIQLHVGSKIQFVPISKHEYLELQGELT